MHPAAHSDDPQEAILATLPGEAASKLRSLIDAADDARAAYATIRNEPAELGAEISRGEQRIRELERNPKVKSDDLVMTAARGKIRSLIEKKRRLSERVAAISESAQSKRATVSHCNDYLSQLRERGIVVALHERKPDAAAAVPDLRPGEAISKLRARLDKLRADAHTVRSAPIKSATAKALAIGEIDRLAEAGRPGLGYLISAGGKIGWPFEAISAAGSPHVVSVGHGLAFVAWMFRDAVVAAISREIDSLADDKDALDDDERAKKTTNLAKQILEVERAEECLIENCAAGGSPFLRREDADPRAILGLSSELPSPSELEL